jgi:DNA polymerase III subunit epsilon
VRRGPVELSGPTPTVESMTAGSAASLVQTSLDELLDADQGAAFFSPGAGMVDDLPLHQVTFVVVDLETTGGSPADCEITEIGAVKVCGGEVLGEYQTLVNPGGPIPPFISVLTGITDSMVGTAPQIRAALPAFLEFARGAVLVAHNARFDVSFLKAACLRSGVPWPGFAVLDTVHLARQVLPRDEVPNHKLASLARLFGSPVSPDHRALTDARATVHVLHALIGRVGNLGVVSLDELTRFSRQVPEATRRKRHLADGLPHAPGVYLFRDGAGRVLYVGTSVDIRSRVLSYFTSSEQRRRIAEMVRLATDVTPVVCATPLEARVREIRLIAEHAPAYNRRSRHPDRAPWVKLTDEPFPRLSVVREVRDDGASYFGPFGSSQQARLAVAALHEAFPIRQCTGRLPARPAPTGSACLLAEIGRCGAPCVGGQTIEQYAVIAAAARNAIAADAQTVVRAALARTGSLAEQRLFEEAAAHRDRMTAFLRGAARTQRVAPLAAVAELVAARRSGRGGWELVLIRHGRLAGTTLSPRGADPLPFIEALRQSGEVVLPQPAPLPAAHPEEAELVIGWLEQPGVRLVELDGEWACPVTGASRWLLPRSSSPDHLG